LAEIWSNSNAEDRSKLSAAANEIDERLRRNPSECGESREAGRRILLIPPLGAKLRVFPDDRIVCVLEVWRFEKRVK